MWTRSSVSLQQHHDEGIRPRTTILEVPPSGKHVRESVVDSLKVQLTASYNHSLETVFSSPTCLQTGTWNLPSVACWCWPAFRSSHLVSWDFTIYVMCTENNTAWHACRFTSTSWSCLGTEFDVVCAYSWFVKWAFPNLRPCLNNVGWPLAIRILTFAISNWFMDHHKNSSIV